jgi:hypothetical protein
MYLLHGRPGQLFDFPPWPLEDEGKVRVHEYMSMWKSLRYYTWNVGTGLERGVDRERRAGGYR